MRVGCMPRMQVNDSKAGEVGQWLGSEELLCICPSTHVLMGRPDLPPAVQLQYNCSTWPAPLLYSRIDEAS